MADFLFWLVGAFLVVLVSFGAGYLVAARGFGKEVRFYKDCIQNQKTTIQGYLQEIELMQRAMKGDR